MAELAGMHLRQPTTGSGVASALNAGVIIAVSALASLAARALLATLEHVTARARATCHRVGDRPTQGTRPQAGLGRYRGSEFDQGQRAAWLTRAGDQIITARLNRGLQGPLDHLQAGDPLLDLSELGDSPIPHPRLQTFFHPWTSYVIVPLVVERANVA